MLTSDTVLQGRYRIVRQLGQGGMGAVYEAIDERLDTVVALKETLFTEEKLRKQFEREARLLAGMHHQALPRVSDHFKEGDGQFLVMQYIAGEDLFEMLGRRSGPFPQEEVLRWADQLCDALDYLHTQDPQIIHRDIKPQNLKLTARGQIVLLDFGLAKGFAGQMSVVTTSASIFGFTPNYAPLEQVQGLGTDPRSDIYSLAATLYHMMTNLKPPDALSRAAAIVNGLPDPLPLASAVYPHVSPTVAEALNKGMSQKRDNRYPSASAMRSALLAAAEHSMGAAETVIMTGARDTAGANTVSPEQQTMLKGPQTRAFGNEAQTILAADATSVRGRTTIGETATVVRPVSGARSPRIWLAAAVFLVLLAVSVGAFYAYHSGTGEAVQNVVDPGPQSSPQGTDTKATSGGSPTNAAQTDGVRAGESKTEKTTAQRTTSKQSADKTKETGNTVQQNPNPTPGDRPAAAHDVEQNPDRRREPPLTPRQETPPYDPVRPPPGAAHPRGTGQQFPDVRTFPNGTRMVTRPDGTRIVTLPDGTTRVIPPNKPLRRRRP